MSEKIGSENILGEGNNANNQSACQKAART
jgi:hypothetical protein